MGVNTFQYGDDIVGYIVLQDTFGTAKKPAGTNAFRCIDLTMGHERSRPEVNDRRGTRSLMERVEGRTPLQPWSATVILRPSGSLGVAPDIGDLLKLALGTETVVASTSVTYTLLKDPTGLHASIYKKLSSMQEGVYDAVVQNVEISWGGDQFITLTFSGVASEYIGPIGQQPASGSGSGATALVVDDADSFTKFGILQNETASDDNSGSGYQITADPNHTTETLTISPAASWDDNDVWGPFLPSGSFAGDPLYGTKGQVSLDGGSSTVNFVSGSISIATGNDLYNSEFGTQQASDVVLASARRVSGSLSFTLKEGEEIYQSQARRKVAQDLQIIFGDTATKRMTFDTGSSQVEIDPGQPTSPESGPVEHSLSFVCMGSSGEDECSLLFD